MVALSVAVFKTTMATHIQLETAAMEASRAAEAMMWEMAEDSPLIAALMREDNHEVARLMEQSMLEVKLEVDEILGEIGDGEIGDGEIGASAASAA